MPAVRAALCIVLTLAPAAAGAQSFTADTGIVTYTIRADRTAAFDAAVQRLLAGLRQPHAQDVEPGVSLRVLRQASPGDAVSYVLIADPAAASVDYSLPALVDRTFEGTERDDLRQQLAFALQGATVTAIDLRAVGAVSPLDRLRERIALDLGDTIRGDDTPSTSNAALEALRGPVWAVDALTHQARRQGTGWQVDWSLSLRNISLTRALDADLVVELVDDRGGVLSRSAPEPVSLAIQDSTRLSGTIDMQGADGSRVLAARVRVTPH